MGGGRLTPESRCGRGALDLRDRVLSLVLISTSPAMPGERDLPAATERYRQLLTTAEVDWSDEGSVIEYLVDYSRALAGGECPFDERLAALVDTLVLEELANRNAPMPP